MSKLFCGLLGASVVLGAGYFYLVAPRTGKRAPKRDAFHTSYAHRGLHGLGVPENSLAAFSAAIDSGYGIELDLRLSRDGEVMVFHDENLYRMTGKKARLKDYDAAELRTLRLQETDQQIPFLSEVLQLVDGKVPLLIELKGERADDVHLCEVAERILRTYDGPWCVESFNPIQLNWWKKNRPDIVRGQLVTNLIKKKDGTYSKRPVDYLLSGLLLNAYSRPDFIAVDGRMKNPSVTVCEKLFGADKFIWTVRGNMEREKAENAKAYPIFEYEPSDFGKEMNDER